LGRLPNENEDKIASMDIPRTPTNLPDRSMAELLASALVRNRFTPYFNFLQPCHSVYRWQGGIEKTNKISNFSALQISCTLSDYFAYPIAKTGPESWLLS
jgi:hypothetical protein